MIQTVKEILVTAKRAETSDIHITVGIPPGMRVDDSFYNSEDFGYNNRSFYGEKQMTNQGKWYRITCKGFK